MGDNKVSEAVLKQEWIQALLCYVQHCLDAQNPDTSLPRFARTTDRILERDTPNGSHTIHNAKKEGLEKDSVMAELNMSVKSLTQAFNKI
ncbi:hypothetical protein Smp_079720 [Schistosoma mansoni]|uniref:hypothetical protein n=1 Tax=Schistosoma mansoni TaxID=6183 RepID=UPI0001A62AD4|nr:hypothetical protein Smp_079720 [Schistosoma mansoni]|eukprot:XP_018651233.1 hypothetical protein Smp_079720 [Schistosoma mansoni]